MDGDITETTSERTPIFDDLLDAATKVRPIILQTICWFVFGMLLAAAPSLTRWVVVALVMVSVPRFLELRSRLGRAEVRLREATHFEGGVCAAMQIAMAKVEELEAELVAIRRRPGEGTGDPIYRSVGLDVDAPNYLVEAARRAHRVALHPDKQRPEHRQAAHDRYVAIDSAFDEIDRRRKT